MAHDTPLSDTALRVKALESLLVEKKLVDSAALDIIVDTFENKVGPRNGARVVARAWVDPDYKQRLLQDGSPTIAELGYSGFAGEDMVVLENTPEVHNVVVCTLCSCYPWPTLGLPPKWYKSPAYRSRVVIDPRGVLREFGIEIPDSVSVRVWDSNAELRYLVLPMRPPGTDDLTEDELAALVTRDSMIGTGLPKSPDGPAAVNSAHDVGGMHAVGPIVAPASEPAFHEEWEGRLFGMALSMLVGGHYNLNEARHATERMEPGRYFSSSYFEQWLYFFELLMVEKGILTEAEIVARETEILAGRT